MGHGATPSPPRIAEPAAVSRSAAVTASLGGVFLYSLSPVLVRQSDLSGPAFSFWRMLLAVPVLAVAAAVMRRRARSSPPTTPATGGTWLLLVGGLGLAANQLFTMSALKLTSVANVTLIGTLAPVIVGVAAFLLLAERQSRTVWLWTVVAMAGAGFVVVAAAGGVKADLWGMALALSGVVSFAGFMLAARHSRHQLSGFLLWTTASGSLVLIGFVAVTGTDIAVTHRGDVVRLLLVIFGSATVGHALFTWSLRATSAGFGAAMRLTQPLMASAIAWFLLGEPVGAAQWWGGAVILVGVAGVAYAGRQSTVTPVDAPSP